MKRMWIFIFIIVNSMPLLAVTQSKKDTPIVEPKKETLNNPASLFESIQKELRDQNYRKEILPNNFSYLLQLLQHGSKTKLDRDFAVSVISLFSKLLKGAEYVNAYNFGSLIDQLPNLTKHYFTPNGIDNLALQNNALQDLDMFDRLEKSVSSIIYNKFTKEFAQAQENPQQFLDDLSAKIVTITKQEIGIEQLRQTIIRFLEVGISKLVWNAHDPEQSWDSVKKISHNLASLMESNIIDDLNDLDDLFWSLTHRYCYFLELNSSDVPLSCYKKIKQDISEQRLMLFDLEEQEPFMQSKSECIMHVVLSQEVKNGHTI
jgi:hypothetical protein